jgi:1-acyl-sn-glycerol-3-phosphate acyltransferase
VRARRDRVLRRAAHVIDPAEVTAWLVAQIARELHLDPAAIDVDKPIAVLGLDSLTVATLSADLEDHFGRSLPERLLRHDLTIATLSAIVAHGTNALAPTEDATAVAAAPAASASVGWTLSQRALLTLARSLARLLTRIDVAGADRLPGEGAVVVAVNHLHILDALWAFVVIPRRTVFLVASEFRNRPLVGQLLRLGDSIFVERGVGDYDAARRAVDALRGGAAIGIAPEGRLSPTGALIRGQPGFARIAADAGAPVVPLAMSGQERMWRSWLRLRRIPIRARFGPAIPPPPRQTTARALEEYSDRVMRALAEELPPEYRGVYRQ